MCQLQIVSLARRHRRYGSEMIYLKLRQDGMIVNHKRVEWLYVLEKLQIRCRRRKKERIRKRIYKTRELTRADVFDYIEVF